MTNDLFRDYLDGRIPGHETPRTVTITVTPEWRRPITHSDHAVRISFSRLREAIESYLAIPRWIDYGAQRGLTGLGRAHFNDAVDKMTSTTPWTRDECATMLGKIMDAAEKADLGQLQPNPAADPRARALWAKQQQGHGPEQEPLRVRGRNNHYKEKR